MMHIACHLLLRFGMYSYFNEVNQDLVYFTLFFNVAEVKL
jgi:hypothetical protein